MFGRYQEVLSITYIVYIPIVLRSSVWYPRNVQMSNRIVWYICLAVSIKTPNTLFTLYSNNTSSLNIPLKLPQMTPYKIHYDPSWKNPRKLYKLYIFDTKLLCFGQKTMCFYMVKYYILWCLGRVDTRYSVWDGAVAYVWMFVNPHMWCLGHYEPPIYSAPLHKHPIKHSLSVTYFLYQ